MELLKVILVFGLIVIAFDGIWATIAKAGGYTYANGIWCSWLIYILAGVVAYQNENPLYGLISGMFVAGIDATIGWWVSSVIGPGRIPDKISQKDRPKVIRNAILTVMIHGAMLGLLGAFLKSKFDWLIG